SFSGKPHGKSCMLWSPPHILILCGAVSTPAYAVLMCSSQVAMVSPACCTDVRVGWCVVMIGLASILSQACICSRMAAHEGRKVLVVSFPALSSYHITCCTPALVEKKKPPRNTTKAARPAYICPNFEGVPQYT
ncbi:unnamed protein product, partial [Ectocarpus fasciculatus]